MCAVGEVGAKWCVEDPGFAWREPGRERGEPYVGGLICGVDDFEVLIGRDLPAAWLRSIDMNLDDDFGISAGRE